MKYLYPLLILILLISCGQSNLISIKENGILIETYEIDQDSLRHGVTKKFYPTGQTFEKSIYKHGKLNGERLLFYENGVVEIRENYCDGMFCDTITTFYKSGIKRFEGVYNHGIMTGIVRGYFESGALKEEVTFLDNMEQGPFTEYHENGNIKWQGTYLNGPNEFGELTEFNDSGEKIKVMICDTLAICRTVWSVDDNS